MKSMLKAGLAALGLSLIAMPQMVSAQGYQPGRVVQAVEEADLEAVVLALGHSVQERQPMGPRSIRAVTPNGLIYFMRGTNCDQGGVRGCLGLSIQVRVETPPRATFNSFIRTSDQHPGLNLWVNREEGVVGLTRFVVVQGGVTMANLAFNVNALLNLTPSAIRTIGREDEAQQ